VAIQILHYLQLIIKQNSDKTNGQTLILECNKQEVKFISTYVLLQLDWQEEHHSVEHADRADDVLERVDHTLAHARVGHLGVEVHVVLVQVEHLTARQLEQIGDELHSISESTCQLQYNTQM